MKTTVQISNNTKQKLEMLKHQEGLKTLDEVISVMADKELKIQKSMFGRSKISPWKRSDRMRFRGE